MAFSKPGWKMRFYDSIAQAQCTGGGTRIKEVRLRDHLRGLEEVHAYDYTTTAADSSGRLLRMPWFVFAAPPATAPLGSTALQQWKDAMVRSMDDMSTDALETRDHTPRLWPRNRNRERSGPHQHDVCPPYRLLTDYTYSVTAETETIPDQLAPARLLVRTMR